MTFGDQISKDKAFELLDNAVSNGINFIDLAEMYPIPAKIETHGDSERIIGDWLRARKCRSNIIISTKMAGPNDKINYIRNGETQFSSKDINDAVDGCLSRLKTDYIDLFQIHWPERKVNVFGKREYQHTTKSLTPVEETLEALNNLIMAGKIRHIGISNETPWGMMKYIAEADRHNLPKIRTIQNVYNLLNRTFEIGHSEICHRENIGLIAYSPLAFGVLTGKYSSPNIPSDSRLATIEKMNRYSTTAALLATEKYLRLSKKCGIPLTKIALSYTLNKPFLLSCIIGVTKADQLIENIQALDTTLDESIINEIEEIHNEHANPVP